MSSRRSELDIQTSIQQYLEACLVVEEKEWVTNQTYSNNIIYYIIKGFLPKSWIHVDFQSGSSGYVCVDASFEFTEATNAEKKGMMAYYKMEVDMLHLKRALRELAKLV